jgi:methylphosphotriester-DNA--protein-cysteine methyltransferase
MGREKTVHLVPDGSQRTGNNPDSTSAPTPMELVGGAMRYFAQHFKESLVIAQVAEALGTCEARLDNCFDQIRGMTPALALREHRLNQLFQALSAQPRQGLGCAIQACGLGQTQGVVALFEQEFGIDMPLFLLTCRRAADDRLFRQLHPEAAALVLPS